MKILLHFIILTYSIFASELTTMQDACERGISEACYELATIYNGSDGLIKQIKKAQKYYTKACDLNNDKACSILEKQYSDFTE